jgi:SAM-dependent methyltransferase
MTECARFHREIGQLLDALSVFLSWRYITEYLADGRTPARALTDEAVKILMPFLEGPGCIVEVGAFGDYYKRFANPTQNYIATNKDGPCDRLIDMTAMDFEDCSIDAFVSVFALEHTYDYQKFLDEAYRCLKFHGRLLLIVPFLYFFHGAPDDYFRFTSSAIELMVANLKILLKMNLGSRELFVAEMYHEKEVLSSRRSGPSRFMLRLLGLPFLLKAVAQSQETKNHAFAHVFLCEKR